MNNWKETQKIIKNEQKNNDMYQKALEYNLEKYTSARYRKYIARNKVDSRNIKKLRASKTR